MDKMKKILIYICFSQLLSATACTQGLVLESDSKILSAQQLIEDINKGKPLTYRDVTFEGDVFFTEVENTTQLAPNTILVSVEMPLYFERCQFTGKVSGFNRTGDTTEISRFTGAVTFYNCRFEKEVDLRGATFDHHFSVNNSLFDGDAQLQAVKVNGDLRIEKAIFSLGLFLQEATIRGICWAKEAEVLGQLSTQQADFWQNAVFAGVHVRGYADFGLTLFRRSAFFEYGKYEDRVNYSGAIFRHRAEWTKARFAQTADMSNTWHAFTPVFTGVEKNEPFVFTNARFDGGELQIEP